MFGQRPVRVQEVANVAVGNARGRRAMNYVRATRRQHRRGVALDARAAELRAQLHLRGHILDAKHPSPVSAIF